MPKFLFFFTVLTLFSLNTYSENCPFCNESVLKRQKFYENSLAIALYELKPMVPGHCLILPKRNVTRFEDLTNEELLSIAEAIRKTNEAVQTAFHTSSYLLLQKNGKEVGQTVSHLHFHYIPRKSSETSSYGFLFQFFLYPTKKNLSSEKLEENVSLLKRALEHVSISN